MAPRREDSTEAELELTTHRVRAAQGGR
jgi:hypothetical protein